MATGFKIAGVVLGAIPIVIAALNEYREVAKRFNLYREIQLYYKECIDNLNFQQLHLRHNMTHLIRPLSAEVDDDKINELLDNPGGAGWKDNVVSAMFEKRLHRSYELYLSYIRGMQQTLEELRHELALDDAFIQDQLQRSSTSKTSPNLRERWNFRLYKSKFSNGESARDRAFTRLSDYNNKLEKLKQFSDDDARLAKGVTQERMKVVDKFVCIFWEQATKVFKTIASSWTCPGQHRHYARLQLQHRTPKTHDFTLLFEMSGQAPLPWEKRRARISTNAGIVSAPGNSLIASPRSKIPIRVPSPASGAAPQLAVTLRGPSKPSHIAASPMKVSNSSMAKRIHGTARLGTTTQIKSLCSSLEGFDQDCCGYLRHDGCQYFVYAEVTESHGWQKYSTLEEILKAPQLIPKVGERYAISLIVASSIVQYLRTPWLPGSLSKSDIIFFQNTEVALKGREAFDFHQPHVTRQVIDSIEKDVTSDDTSLGWPMSQLGILLLELHFGSVLEEQECRERYGDGANATQSRAFDVMAALDWWEQAEKGDKRAEFALVSGAVAWCLKGCHSTNDGPGGWRQDMFKEVIQPLLDCRDHLTAGNRNGV